MSLAPDRIVIRGDIAADALKAEQAATRLQEQLDAIRETVVAEGGELTLAERTRAILPGVAALNGYRHYFR